LKDRDSQGGQRHNTSAHSNEFSVAVSRLEKAVQDLLSATTGQISERATSLLDDTSKRLESELRLNRFGGSSDESEHRRSRRRRRHRHRHKFSDTAERYRSKRRGLSRSKSDHKIAGVCAGIARHFGVDTWMVRIGALTGLIFLPGIVFPAYWIAYFVMGAERVPKGSSQEPLQEHQKTHPERNKRVRGVSPDAAQILNPRLSLRHTSEDFSQAELRLRRLESFVTSDQYELHKELTKIEREEGVR